MRLVVLTGASGSGKTAIANAIKIRRPNIAEVLHFDSIGVPSSGAMVAGWGTGEAWQRAMTLAWMARIATMSGHDRPVLFEGQMRLSFVRKGLLSSSIADARMILVDCNDATRSQRLSANRNQPELASSTMMDWAAFLRREAQMTGCEVLDTSEISLEESVEQVCRYLGANRPRGVA